MMFSIIPFQITDSFLKIGALIIGLGLAVILHEIAHGYVALRLGDPTAKLAGRLTLNPIKHIDLLGTIVLPILMYPTGFIFGWAKPVPVNYYNLKKGKYGPVLVAMAGPVMNLLLMAVFGSLVRFAPQGTALPSLFYTIAFINGVLMLFNLIPIPPLDGSKILYVFLEKRPDIIQFLERYSLVILLILIFFGQGFIQVWIGVPLRLLLGIFTGSIVW